MGRCILPILSLNTKQRCTTWCKIHNTEHCTQHTVRQHWTLKTKQWIVHTAHCTANTEHNTLHTAHCTLHTAHCALHTANAHYLLHPENGTLHTAQVHTASYLLHINHKTVGLKNLLNTTLVPSEFILRLVIADLPKNILLRRQDLWLKNLSRGKMTYKYVKVESTLSNSAI